MSDEPSFENIFSELELIVGQLERGEISLDESLKLFEKGVLLCRTGAGRLDHAERTVEQLLQSNAGEATIQAWEGTDS